MRTGSTHRLERLVLIVPAVLPLLWWEVMSNHSQVHAWFTYRSIAFALGLVATVALLPLGVEAADPEEDRATDV